MIKLQDLLYEVRPYLNEDWFDEYLAYVEKVFYALGKRFKIPSSQKGDLMNSFGEKLEQGWKDDIDPNKLALQIIPMGQTYKLYKWGN